MGIEFEELVELNPRLETQTATATFTNSPVTQTITQTAVVVNSPHADVDQNALNFAGALAVG